MGIFEEYQNPGTNPHTRLGRKILPLEVRNALDKASSLGRSTGLRQVLLLLQLGLIKRVSMLKSA